MRARIITILLIVVFLGTILGCSTWRKLDRTERGAIIGTGTGAAIGGASGGTTGAIVGGAAGGIAGGVIGHELDENDENRRRRHR